MPRDLLGQRFTPEEFLHADDLGEACVFALEHWSALSEDALGLMGANRFAFLNVGTGIDLSIRELAEAVADAVGFTGTIYWDTAKPDGTPKKQLDVSRLAAMGWQARISLVEGLPWPPSDFLHQLKAKRLRS